MNAGLQGLVAIGSYGQSRGLTTWHWDGAGGFTQAGSADTPAPAFVCWHPTRPLLYAVSEVADGRVTALSVAADGSLTALASTSTGGAEPCWVTCDPLGSALLIANYDGSCGASSTAVLRLGADGLPTGDATVLRHGGSGPLTDRQSASHVHQVVPTAYGTILATDLGADRIIEYEIGRRDVTEVGRVDLPAGSGPRHVVLSSDGSTAFVAGELDGTITVIRRSSGTWGIAAQVPCTGSARVPREVPWNRVYPSHLALTGRDRYLLVANRGVNTLAVLDVSNGLAVVSEEPVAAWPRHFALVNDMVLVAAQHGNAVQAHRFDPATGSLTSLGAVAEVASASCVAAHPLR